MIIIHHLSIMIVVCNDVIIMSDINFDMCADRTSSALID